jgi:DNA polymerase I-like protein with 3'-5' exonuclease and polymerase domains
MPTILRPKRIRGGMPSSRDGKVRTIYSHNPSTLRLASQQPNLQNLPRPSKDKEALQNIIRNLIVAEPGTTFLARDFSGIEAVLVGLDANDAGYTRLARRDVHSFYTAYALNQLDGRVSGNDLPLLSWDDDKLFSRLAEIKEAFKNDRNTLYKHLVHAINFGQGAKGAQEKIYKETDIVFDVKLITRLMDIYRELFPKIPKWQRDTRFQAHEQGYLRNAFGYVHRFNHVFTYKLKNGVWDKVPGDDAEAVLAFRPQSNAAGIMKEALLRLYFNRYEEAGQYLRMTIHDEIFCQVPPELRESVDNVLREEMERPVPQCPLPASWSMGERLVVLTESKYGDVWGSMK